MKTGEVLGKLSYAKNEYNVSYHKLDAGIYNFFRKTAFSEETAKNYFEGAFDQGGSSRRQSRLTNKFTHHYLLFYLCGWEFSYQNIVATTSSPQSMLPPIIFIA